MLAEQMIASYGQQAAKSKNSPPPPPSQAAFIPGLAGPGAGGLGNIWHFCRSLKPQHVASWRKGLLAAAVSLVLRVLIKPSYHRQGWGWGGVGAGLGPGWARPGEAGPG